MQKEKQGDDRIERRKDEGEGVDGESTYLFFEGACKTVLVLLQAAVQVLALSMNGRGRVW